MRIIATRNLKSFAAEHPDAKASLERWLAVMGSARCNTMADIQGLFPSSKVLNGDRVRFEVAGGNYRLIAAFKLKNQLAFVKFIGPHAEYDRIDALTISQF